VSDLARRRVVVTGVGLVSPLGVGTAPTWEGIVGGRSGIGPITRFDVSEYPCRIAGEVEGFDAADWMERKEIKKVDLFCHYGVAASQMALEDSGFLETDYDGDRVGSAPTRCCSRAARGASRRSSSPA
jgi:3-oxoacyl-[acyl-carrier-protein] synthase II